MATARDLIKGSLRLVGTLATGETPTADESNDALSALNDMIDSWSTESLMIYSKVREEFSLVAGQSSYTMGSSGDFNTTRPQKIENALIQDSGSSPAFELPIKIVTKDEFANITVKDATSAIPTYLYPSGTYPLETLTFYPVPSVAKTIVLYSWKPLTTLTSLNTVISVPPGYMKAMRYALALELAPEYGIEPPMAVVIQATESKENIKRMNIKPSYLSCDDATLRQGASFNWLTGES